MTFEIAASPARVAPEMSADLLIIGGGIHGCSAALHAAKRGMKVIVIEKDSVARHSSGVNAGGVRRLGRHYAEVPLSQHSMQIWYKLGELLDDDTGFQVAPQIRIAETEEELSGLRQRVSDLNDMGFTHEVILSPEEVRGYLPALTVPVAGALASLRDGYAQPFWTTFAFYQKAAKIGVCFYEGCSVEKIHRAGKIWQAITPEGIFRAPKLLVAAGAWSGRIAETLGERAPEEAIAPMMIVTSRLPPFCDAVVGAAGRPLSFKQMPNGTVVIGGGRRGRVDPGSNKSEILFNQLYKSAGTVTELFPIMRQASAVRTWSGVEGRMPDDIPVLGPSARHEGLYYEFGFSAHGFQMGPGVGDIMAELIATGTTWAPLEPFSISRFLA